MLVNFERFTSYKNQCNSAKIKFKKLRKMKKRFRVSKNDTIKATASGQNGLLSTVYDSEFTTIAQIVSRLISKIPYYSGKIIEISIYNNDKQTVKYLSKKVNR